jgi:hypothetical protein
MGGRGFHVWDVEKRKRLFISINAFPELTSRVAGPPPAVQEVTI